MPGSSFDAYDLALDRRDKTGPYARPRSAARLSLLSLAWAILGLVCEVIGLMALGLGLTPGSLLSGAALGSEGVVVAPVGGLLTGVLLSIPLLVLALVSLVAVLVAFVSTLLASRREHGLRRAWPTLLALVVLTGFTGCNGMLWTCL